MRRSLAAAVQHLCALICRALVLCIVHCSGCQASPWCCHFSPGYSSRWLTWLVRQQCNPVAILPWHGLTAPTRPDGQGCSEWTVTGSRSGGTCPRTSHHTQLAGFRCPLPELIDGAQHQPTAPTQPAQPISPRYSSTMIIATNSRCFAAASCSLASAPQRTRPAAVFLKQLAYLAGRAARPSACGRPTCPPSPEGQLGWPPLHRSSRPSERPSKPGGRTSTGERWTRPANLQRLHGSGAIRQARWPHWSPS